MNTAIILILVWISVLVWALWYISNKRREIGSKIRSLERDVQGIQSRIDAIAGSEEVKLL